MTSALGSILTSQQARPHHEICRPHKNIGKACAKVLRTNTVGCCLERRGVLGRRAMRCSLKLLKTRAQALWHRGVSSHRKLIRKPNSHWARISPVTFLNEPHVATAVHQGHKHLIAEWLKGGNGIHTAGMLDSVMSHANLKLQCVSGALQSTWSTCWLCIYRRV